MTAGFIIISTQTGTHRNSLYAPAYHFVDITGMIVRYRTIPGQTISADLNICGLRQDNDRTGGSGIGGSHQNAKSHSG